jgi:hypothetical protein
MKIIDLLNKIANNEIKEEFNFKIWDEEWKVSIGGYYVDIVNASGTNLFQVKNFNVLSAEIEIIKEYKPIEKLSGSCDITTSQTCRFNNIEVKVNEIIDKLNKLKKESDK